MLQLVLTVIIFMIIVIPIGNYLYHIASGQRTFADPVFDRVDGGIFKVCGIHPDKGMNWKQYALALLLTNAVMVFVGYLVLRIQFLPIFNPNGIGAMEETLSFNTIISFMTNTNLQHYSGESGLSYLSQMLVITYMMFVSAATGYAACIAFVRGLAGKSKDNVGNFYADLVKVTTRVLIPLSIIGGMLLIWQGVPQNFDPNVTVTTIEGTQQDIAMGPVAALEIMLANSAIRNHIREAKTFQIPTVMQTNRKNGMRTMDDALLDLFQSRLISRDNALAFAQNRAALSKNLGYAPIPDLLPASREDEF